MPRGLTLTLPPVGEPLTLAEAKNHLRVDVSDDDALIYGHIVAARSYLEAVYNLSLVSRTFTTTIDRFPRYSSSAVWQYNSDAIWQQRLPVTQLSGQWYPDRASIRVTRPPMQTLLSITYIDGTGVQQMLVNNIPAGVAAGVQTVTPSTMLGVTAGLSLIVDTGLTQETITVTSVTATTFTATFAKTHATNVPTYAAQALSAGAVLTGDALVNVDLSTPVARVAPGFGAIWPIIRQRLASVNMAFVAGFGPVTTANAAIAAGSTTVTPASMTGIYPGTVLVIDRLNAALRESVTVASTTATTFTAVFANAHAASATVEGDVPEQVRSALKLLVGHAYENREAVTAGTFTNVPMGVDALMMSVWSGEYE